MVTGEEEGDAIKGDLAEQYLRKFSSESGVDKTFELRDRDGSFRLGRKQK